MKNNYNRLSRIVAASFTFALFTATAQTNSTLDFETFTLSAGATYSPGTSTPFQQGDASFQYKYSSGYWSGGFAYTRVNDSINGTYTNLYGVRAYNGYTGSATYVVGQNHAVLNLTAPQTTVNGFYVTNTTYAYKSILKGDQFSRKFGDTTGTGSGTTIAQGSYPDYFKLIVRGYKNGSLKSDSATFMLADYTFTNNAQDYVLNSWQYVNTSGLGEVDSLVFSLRSTDAGAFGMNTPGFFAVDNMVLSRPSVATGVKDESAIPNVSVYPNPFSSVLMIDMNMATAEVSIRDLSGKIILQSANLTGKTSIDLSTLESGIYLVEINTGAARSTTRVVKQ